MRPLTTRYFTTIKLRIQNLRFCQSMTSSGITKMFRMELIIPDQQKLKFLIVIFTVVKGLITSTFLSKMLLKDNIQWFFQFKDSPSDSFPVWLALTSCIIYLKHNTGLFFFEASSCAPLFPKCIWLYNIHIVYSIRDSVLQKKKNK